MKKILVLLALAYSNLSFSQNSGLLIYTTGPQKGKVVKDSGFFGMYSICYKGNPWWLRTVALRMMNNDPEKEYARAWYNQKTKNIDVRYIDTKCLDDSLDATRASCTQRKTIKKCN